jgi:hypothetical protein
MASTLPLLLVMVLGHGAGAAGSLVAPSGRSARGVAASGAIVGSSAGLILGLDALIRGTTFHLDVPQLLALAGMLAELEPALDEIVVTRNSSDRSMEPGETAELAAEIFGEERVRPAPRLDDAIEAAVTLADEAAAESLPGSGAVLITGSVITAGDARRLLGPSGGELPPEPPASQPSRHSFTAAELS